MWKAIKRWALLCYRAGDHLADNHGVEMAGYLTFLSLLALFPYLVLIVSVAGLVGQGEMGRQFIALLLEHLPADAVKTIRPRIEEITSGPPQGLLTFSIIGAIWTSSSAVETVRGILNRAYRVSKPPTYFARRMLSILQILIFTMAILFVMVLLVFAPIAMQAFTDYTHIAVPTGLANFFHSYFFYIGGVALFIMVASFYYVLPNIQQTLAGVVPGALLVVMLWIGGAAGVTFYLNSVSQVTLIYGSLSGFIATLIFFYVMNLIFIYGAEFNHEVMLALGDRIVEREAPAGETVH